MISQLTVFLKNEPGALAKATQLISGSDIQIHGLMVSNVSDFAIARIVCDKPWQALETLVDRKYQASISRVVAIAVENVPGGLARLLNTFADENLNVEYAYCCSIADMTVDILKVAGDPKTVEESLRKAGVMELTAKEIAIEDQA